jgi:hypothetical protein
MKNELKPIEDVLKQMEKELKPIENVLKPMKNELKPIEDVLKQHLREQVTEHRDNRRRYLRQSMLPQQLTHTHKSNRCCLNNSHTHTKAIAVAAIDVATAVDRTAAGSRKVMTEHHKGKLVKHLQEQVTEHRCNRR